MNYDMNYITVAIISYFIFAIKPLGNTAPRTPARRNDGDPLPDKGLIRDFSTPHVLFSFGLNCGTPEVLLLNQMHLEQHLPLRSLESPREIWRNRR